MGTEIKHSDSWYSVHSFDEFTFNLETDTFGAAFTSRPNISDSQSITAIQDHLQILRIRFIFSPWVQISP